MDEQQDRVSVLEQVVGQSEKAFVGLEEPLNMNWCYCRRRTMRQGVDRGSCDAMVSRAEILHVLEFDNPTPSLFSLSSKPNTHLRIPYP